MASSKSATHVSFGGHRCVKHSVYIISQTSTDLQRLRKYLQVISNTANENNISL